MKFNVKDYSGDYAMVVESYEEACEFAQVLHDQGMLWSNGMQYVNSFALPRVKAFDFNRGRYWSSPVEFVRARWPQYKLLYWKDFRDGDVPSITLNFEDIFGLETEKE